MATNKTAKANEQGNIFLNFNDQRGQKTLNVSSRLKETVESIPEGERVVLILSKAEFGRLNVPLDLKAAEQIS